MKIALCIEGGGAKGAYEAGVIKALYDNGIKEYSAVAGTSIGAINGYFVTTGNIEKLSYVWNNTEEFLWELGSSLKIVNNTIDNEVLMTVLNKIEEGKRKEIPLYVNYVEVKGYESEEKVVDTSKYTTKECMEFIKYSSLLPCNPNKNISFRERFAEGLKEGIYDGFCLDGGIVRSLLLSPLLEEDTDKIVVISTKDNYELKEEVVEKFGKEKFVISRPKYKFDPNATLNMDGDFCRKIFKEGYEIGKELLKQL